MLTRSDEKFFLRPNVQMEPLVSQWPAWPHLIAPATSAMNVAYLHLKVMKSFIMAPDLHAATLKDPTMRGGLFLNLDPRKVDEVKALSEQTLKEQAHMINLAEAIKTVNVMLLNEAKGFSLEGLYQQIPPILKGYVELVYDLNNQPSIRFFEGLLYHSSYYDPARQSISLALIDSDDRPFLYMTPRFTNGHTVNIDIPFKHQALDNLFEMRTSPRTFEDIKDRLAFSDRYNDKFRTLITTDPPRRTRKYDGDGVRVRYLNHACILIETKDISILTDPLLPYEYERTMPCLTYADLPEVLDYVLITHGHPDHLVLETLLQLRHKIQTLIIPRSGGGTLEDPSLKLILQNIGFKHVVEIDDLETIPIEGGTITGLPFLGEHADLNIRSKIAHLVQLQGKSILSATDSRNVSPEVYAKVHEVVGDIDVLFLGMECDGAPFSWMYGQLATGRLARDMDQSRRLSGSDFKLGMEIVNALHCKQAYVYAMGQEPWLNYLTSIHYTDQSKPIIESNKLVDACRRQNIPSERLYGPKEIVF
jgi:L-ascorbate metabolism protein UlaG (beta-lactamase superfamily)